MMTKLPKKQWLIAIIVGTLALCACSSMEIGIAIGRGIPAQTTSPHVSYVATLVPTATTKPKPTPAPTLTAQQRQFGPLLRAISGYGQKFTISTDSNSITVIDDWSGIAQPQVAGAFAQIEIFNVMKLLWTQWHQQWPYVTVVIRIPMFDGTPVAFASAFLSHDTETSFDWPNLLPGSAWQQYDSAFLDPSAQP